MFSSLGRTPEMGQDRCFICWVSESFPCRVNSVIGRGINTILNEPNHQENWLGKDRNGKKRRTCAWWACGNMNGTFVECSKYIMLSYSGRCQRRIHCNQTTTYCSLFFLVFSTSTYHYLVQKLIQMSNVVWEKNRDMAVASTWISVHNSQVY